MDWLTACTKVIDSVAWPVVVVIIVIILKKSIAEVLARINKFKGFGAEVSLDNEIALKTADVLEQSDKVVAAVASDKVDKQIEAVGDYRKAKEELERLIAYRSHLLGQLPSGHLASGLPTLLRVTIPQFGADRLASMTIDELVAEWPAMIQIPNARTGHPLNAGILTGLRAAGVVNANDEITQLGAEMLINTAKQTKLAEALAKQGRE